MGMAVLKGLIFSLLSVLAVFVLKTARIPIEKEHEVAETKRDDVPKRKSGAMIKKRSPAGQNYVEKRIDIQSREMNRESVPSGPYKQDSANDEEIVVGSGEGSSVVSYGAYSEKADKNESSVEDKNEENNENRLALNRDHQTERESRKYESSLNTIGQYTTFSNQSNIFSLPVPTSIVSNNSTNQSSSSSNGAVNANVNIAHIGIENENLVISGSNLDKITNIRINGNLISADLTSLSQTSSQIIARSLSGIALALNTIYDLVISDAYGQVVTYPVEVVLPDGSVELTKLEPLTAAEDGWTIVWDDSLGQWIPAAGSGGTVVDVTTDVAVKSIGVGTAAPGAKLDVQGTLTSAAAVEYGAKILPTINQSGTAGYTGLLINAIETATGSGAKKLLDLQVDGVSKFTVSNTGVVTTSVPMVGSTASYSSTAGPQLSVGYDGSNYVTTSVSSAGHATYTATGASAGYQFNGGNVGIGATSSSSKLLVQADNASAGQVVRSGAAQVGNLMEFQANNGTVLSSFDSLGRLRINHPGMGTEAFAAIGGGSTIGNTSLAVVPGNAAWFGQVIRATAGQAADLLQVQDSAGTAVIKMAGITNAGKITISNPSTDSLFIEGIPGSGRGLQFGTPATGTVTSYFNITNGNVQSRYLEWRGEGVSRGAFTADGRFGINTTTPAGLLDVVGGAKVGGTLATATTIIGAHTNSITSISVADSTSYPSSGILLINNELMTYTSRGLSNFEGVTRGAFGSTAAVINNGDVVHVLLFSIQGPSTSNPKLVMTEEGKLGLGVVNPTRSLEVNGVIAPIDSGVKTFNGGMATEVSSQIINFGINDSSNNRFGGAYTSANQGGFLRLDGRAGPKLFSFFGRQAGVAGAVSELMTISAAGEVGIGGQSTGAKLHVESNANNTFKFNNGAATITPNISISSASGQASALMSGASGSAFVFSNSGFFGIYTDSHANISAGTSAGGSQLLTILSNGNVGIGGATNPSYKFQVGLAADGTEARANAWNTLSDARLKKNFSSIDDALEKILTLDGYFYYWNKGEDKKRKIGLKAQEVEKVFPEAVSKGGDGYLSVSYDHLIAPVISAIKELYYMVVGTQKDVKDLKMEVSRSIASDKEEIERLKAENKAMKDYLCQKDKKAPFCKQ